MAHFQSYKLYLYWIQWTSEGDERYFHPDLSSAVGKGSEKNINVAEVYSVEDLERFVVYSLGLTFLRCCTLEKEEEFFTN